MIIAWRSHYNPLKIIINNKKLKLSRYKINIENQKSSVHRQHLLRIYNGTKDRVEMRTKGKTHRSNSKNNMQEKCKMVLGNPPKILNEKSYLFLPRKSQHHKDFNSF